MRLRISVSIATLLAMMSLAQGAAAQAGNPEAAKPAVVPSVPPPQGWKACPRCQNAEDRKRANDEYKVEGHRFNPRDRSGVWGDQGATVFAKPPAFTPC